MDQIEEHNGWNTSLHCMEQAFEIGLNRTAVNKLSIHDESV